MQRIEQRGAGLTEMIMIVALCAIGLLAVITLFGNDVKDIGWTGSDSIRKGENEVVEYAEDESTGAANHTTGDLGAEAPDNGSSDDGGATEVAYDDADSSDDGQTPGEAALALAQTQVGVTEATGNNDGIPSERYADGRIEPWCADFVAWAFREAGYPLPDAGKPWMLPSVQYMEDQMKAAGKFVAAPGPPKPGDIIFFKNRGGSDTGPGRHVGMVEKIENGRVYTIEGNSGNGVRRRSYPLDHARISGYGRM